MWDGLVDLLFGWVFDLFYLLQCGICTVIDFIVETFYKLSGLESVSVDGKETDLLTHFIETPAVKTAFLGVFLVGVILLCVFVLIAIIRSEYADQQHRRTKGQILVKAGQSFIIFLIIPLLLGAGILLTNTVMRAINGSMLAGVGGTGRTLFGGQILTTSGYNAYIGPAGARAEIERKFITGELDYTKLSVVKQYYHLQGMNFFVGIFSGLVLVILFALAALRFVQRLFDVILLYVISPVSVATIPVDDGARYKLWREMLISKVLSAYGIIFAMNLFFLIVPQVSRIQFYDNGFQNGLIGLLFIIGGAFAVTKAYMVIAQLTGGNAGAQEAQQTMAGIYSGIRMARGATRFMAGAVGQVIGGSDFRSNQRKGMGFGENLNASFHSTRNQRVVDSDARKKKEKEDREKKKNGVPAGEKRGGGNASQPAAHTERSSQTSSSVADTRQYRGANNNTQSQSAFTDTKQSHRADSQTVQTQAGSGQGQFTDKDTPYGADRGKTQDNAGGPQALATDTGDWQLRGADNKAQTDIGGGQDRRTDEGDMRVQVYDKDNMPVNDSVKAADSGSDKMTAGHKMTPGQKTLHFFGGAARLSGLPAGILKDLVQGGLLTVRKNMWPRLRNIVTGRGVINHAEVWPKRVKGGDKTATAITESVINQGANTVKPEQAKPDRDEKKSGGKK